MKHIATPAPAGAWRWLRWVANAVSLARLVAAPLRLALAIARAERAFGVLLAAALLSDIADGLIARACVLAGDRQTRPYACARPHAAPANSSSCRAWSRGWPKLRRRAARAVDSSVARQRWLKSSAFFAIVHGVLLAAAAGSAWIAALVALLVAAGS